MMKLVVAVMTVGLLSACATFDPVRYEKQRQIENAQHLRTTG